MAPVFWKKIVCALYVLTFGLLLTGAARADSSHLQWTRLLDKHVSQGKVDYQGFKNDEAELDRYLGILAATDPETLADADQLAYYINAYNSYTVKLILDNFKNGKPPTSIRKIGGLFANPWKISFAVLGGKTYSLDNIEHDIIRVRFKEPRIHFAVNCASKSCPILISEAYEGNTLEEQLETSTREFLENTEHNHLKGDILYVSSIFKWYSEDFEDGPLAFFLAHVTGNLYESLQNGAGRIQVKFLDYDWSLNSQAD